MAGHTKFTEEISTYLKANYNSFSLQELADKFNVDTSTISIWISRKLRLKRKRLPSGKATQFKKGRVPKRKGKVFINEQKHATVIYIDGKHKMLSRHVWEENFGAVPPGMIVSFKDKNRHNFDPTNLYLTTRAERMRENQINLYPKDLQQVMRISKRLTKKLSEQQPKSST